MIPMLGAENSQVLGQAIVRSLRPERGQAGVGEAGGPQVQDLLLEL